MATFGPITPDLGFQTWVLMTDGNGDVNAELAVMLTTLMVTTTSSPQVKGERTCERLLI